jgi:hypothetical protein
MRITELLLPAGIKDKSISLISFKKIDVLQARMDLYVDKICKMASGTARDFLKSKLKADYTSLKDIIKKNSIVSESIHKLPLTPEDFDMVKRLMEKPIPAIVASIYVMEIIDDDELNDQFKSLEETDPARDVRPLVVDWLRRVMPDQMYRFSQDDSSENQRKGLLSPIHGYDEHSYNGGPDTGTESSGNAYGRR